MAKKILTQEDLDNNPELIEQGLKVGDEIDVPDEDVTSTETNDNENTNEGEDGEPEGGEGDGDGGGSGGNNPTKKPPFTPEP